MHSRMIHFHTFILIVLIQNIWMFYLKLVLLVKYHNPVFPITYILVMSIWCTVKIVSIVQHQVLLRQLVTFRSYQIVNLRMHIRQVANPTEVKEDPYVHWLKITSMNSIVLRSKVQLLTKGPIYFQDAENTFCGKVGVFDTSPKLCREQINPS